MRAWTLLRLATFFVLSACGGSGGTSDGSGGGGAGFSTGPVTDPDPAPTEACGSLRLTAYDAGDGGWCEYDRTAAVLPEFVRRGLTVAIAEPWNNSSYQGEAGEACGECWEVATIDGIETVMVHDLCPVEGNPICNGSHFHFDVSTETHDALGLQGLDEGRARRIPCPVEGNIHLQVNDRNEWGYLRFQVINHRFPIRQVEFRAADGTTWYPAARSGGAWHVDANGEALADGGPGAVFRLTSAQGEVLELPNPLTYDVSKGSYFDLGAQLSGEEATSGAQCRFLPPAEVYVDGYGGIDQVRWMMNAWASASPRETHEGCVSGSCLQVDGIDSGAGFHIYYRQHFAPTGYKSLHLALRSDPGGGSVSVTLGGENGSCQETPVVLTADWSEVTIDLDKVCAGVTGVNSVTLYGSTPLTLFLDDLRFVE